ncbi:MAG: hypothetical protein CML66_03085 [Rhodobacteraceae bacterium]|nr:hypothetical protein [Paracoccaceae bacterium]MAY44288.1 hypothetical protein [Paracoccaceae bacterium]QEW22097.1 hypothetical protein LA6_004312 [Marinibacterium anthonyi]
MNNIHNLIPADDLSTTVAHMIRTHGRARVLLAALRTRLKRKPAKRATFDPRTLNNHLRRDIGLGPTSNSPPSWARFR